jgi:1,4-dihydroxy-6-naphthoate synthase
LGHGCGPLVVSKRLTKLESGIDYEVAIPGMNTTANFLFSMFYPWIKNKKAILFSDIESSLLSEKFHVGVIIHENRFTYEKKGLLKIADLGELWEKETQSPIPLGGIVIKKDIGIETQKKVERIIRRSIEYAYANTPEVMEYVKQYSQEMEESVMKKHIDLYVNEYSLDLGEQGRRAVETFKEMAGKLGMGKTKVPSIKM